MGPVGVGALFLAFLLLLVAGMVWQEGRARIPSTTPTYVLEEATDFVADRLTPAARESIGKGDVRQMLEIGLNHHFADRRSMQPVTIGTVDTAQHIAETASREYGIEYDAEDIAEVLTHELAYLMSIGAVGTEVVDS